MKKIAILLNMCAIFCAHFTFAQNTAFNKNISYSNNIIHRTDPIFDDQGNSIWALWYLDSIAINNQVFHDDDSNNENCLIFKLNKNGQLIKFTNLNIPIPYTRINLRHNPYNNEIVYPICIYNKLYPINSKVSIYANNTSIFGYLTIDSSFNSINFHKIGNSVNNDNIIPNQTDILPIKTGYILSASFNYPVVLYNNDTINLKNPYEIFKIEVNNNHQIIRKEQLLNSNQYIYNYGIVEDQSNRYYFFYYIDTVNIVYNNTQSIVSIKSIFPSLDLSGKDILILKETKSQIIKDFRIGTPSTIYPLNNRETFVLSGGNFFFNFYNDGSTLLDNNGIKFSVVRSKTNSIAVLDTNFNMSYLGSITNSKNTYIYSNISKNDMSDLMLFISSESDVTFNNRKFITDPNYSPSAIYTIFKYKNDSFNFQSHTITRDCRFFPIVFRNGEIFGTLNELANKKIQTFQNQILETNNFSKYYWITSNFDYSNIKKLPQSTVKFSDDFKIYPNPVTENYFHITLSNPNIKNKIISIYDSKGREVETIHLPDFNNSIKLNLHVDNGIYFIKGNWTTVTNTMVVTQK